MLGLLERISSVLLPIGVALYAVLYVGIAQVYWIFNISPQQAGIDQAVLFGRLLLTVILLVVIAVPTAGVLVGIAWLLNVISRGALRRAYTALRARPWFVGLVAGLWCGATYWGLAQVLVDLDVVVMVVVAVGLGVLAFLVPFRLMRRKPVGRAGMKLVVLGLTGIGLGFLLILNLVEAALETQETGQVSEVLLLVGFQDQWAVLEDKEKGEPLYEGRWMMVLGESEGMFAFYDCDKLETLRRPSESVVLTQLVLDPEREPGFTCGSRAG
ncbi:hypothetical protein [Pseudonocardia humida]|uniref:Uncharacterized protein n=1 Tax=Pseudonocardia humida TaxID=2800819 RepID=A0ABT1ADR3_9PSEU|nr:hypothetical protein [Pseudonocardia humida]MCO1661068.1 hypothetical protein [Pseudonocardia humida]